MTLETPCTPLVLQGCKFQSHSALDAVPHASEWMPESAPLSYSGQRPALGFLVFSCRVGEGFAPLDFIEPYLAAFNLTARDLEPLSGTFAKIYKNHGILQHGARIGWNEKRVYVSIPATPLELLEYERIQVGLINLTELDGLLISRLDLSIDDFDRVAEVERVRRSVGVGSLVSRCSEDNVKPHVFFKDRKLLTSGIEFGSRKSETFLRVYDKTLEMMRKNNELLQESPKEYDFVRWEIELHDDRAKEALNKLCFVSDHELSSFIWGLITNHVDFRNKSSNANVSRRKRVVWFQKLTQGCKRVFLTVSKPPDTLGKLRRWFSSQVAPSLALLERAGGADWLSRVLAEGRDRITPKRARLLPVHVARMTPAQRDALADRVKLPPPEVDLNRASFFDSPLFFPTAQQRARRDKWYLSTALLENS